MELVALVFRLTDVEVIRAIHAAEETGAVDVDFAHTQEFVAGAGHTLPLTRVPPAVEQVGTRWSLPGHQGVARDIGDVAHPHMRVQVEDSVSSVYALSLDAKVASEGNQVAPALLGLAGTAVCRAGKNGQRGRQSDMGRVV